MEPHCHGTSKTGNESLRGYQRGGFSRSGEAEGWKMFTVEKISSFRQTSDAFPTNRPGYNPKDSHMDRVHCHV